MDYNNLRTQINQKRLLNGITKTKEPLEYNSVLDCTRNEVGYEGEKSYNDYLNVILDKDFCDISWLNENQESGNPYDFIVRIGDSVSYYIDVKATKGRFDGPIFMSKRELEFALENKESYFIARLFERETDKGKYRAGSFNVELVNINEVLNLIKINK